MGSLDYTPTLSSNCNVLLLESQEKPSTHWLDDPSVVTLYFIQPIESFPNVHSGFDASIRIRTNNRSDYRFCLG